MNENENESLTPPYSRSHPGQPFTSWHPANVQPKYSAISKQQFFLENNSKNVDNIQLLTTESVFREMCPCWKPAPPGTISIFENQN